MAACTWCDQEMIDKLPCTAYPGRQVYADPDWLLLHLRGACSDCYTPVGGMHHPGCHNERCDHGNQAIGDCLDCEASPVDYWERVSGAAAGLGQP